MFQLLSQLETGTVSADTNDIWRQIEDGSVLGVLGAAQEIGEEVAGRLVTEGRRSRAVSATGAV